jgi:hypothetical protein
MRQKWQAKLKELNAELRRRLHDPIPEQGAYLRAVVAGHVRYYGVPLNGAAITAFRKAIGALWLWTLRRRSQRHRLPWARMKHYIQRWLPSARICHPQRGLWPQPKWELGRPRAVSVQPSACRAL